MGEEELLRKHPNAAGYLRPNTGFRLYEKRRELCDKLLEDVRGNKEWLQETLLYPLSADA